VKRLRDGSWMALCPCHPDSKPSLHISQVDNCVLAYCFGCGAKLQDVVKALGLEPDRVAEPEAIYSYRDEDGRLLYQKIRLPEKQFRFRRVLSSGGFEWGLKNTRRVLYNLPEVKAATQVFVVEGEKDADRLMREGLVATTNDDGAGKWRPEFSEALKGKEVIIIPDNDEPGRAHAELVALSVWRLAKSVKVVELPDVPEHGDVSDYLRKHSVEELLKLVEEAPQWTPAPIKRTDLEIKGSNARLHFPEVGVTIFCKRLKFHSDGRLTGLLKIEIGGYTIPYSGVINLASARTRASLAKGLNESVPLPWEEILELTFQRLLNALIEGEPAQVITPDRGVRPRFLIADFLLEGLETVLWGRGGIGKSWIALAIAHSVYTGEPFLGLEVMKRGPTLYLDWEANAEEFKRRLGIIVPEDEEFKLVYKAMRTSLIDSLEAVEDLVLEVDPVLIVIDSFGRAAGGNVIEEATVAQFFAAVRSLGRTVLIIHHPTKNDPDNMYGSAYALWLPRSVWKLDIQEDLTGSLKGILTHVKTNIGRRKGPYAFELTIEPWNLTKIPVSVLHQDRPLTERIEKELLSAGRLSVQELATRLGVEPEKIRPTLNYLKRKGKVEKDRETGFWYALAPF